MLTPAPSSRAALGTNAELHCALDDYTDPWSTPDAVLMIHGIAEDGRIWRPWVPHFARRHRVLRPDLRGYGQSPPLPASGAFSIADWADDLERLIEARGCTRVHLVATKLGAQIAFEMAQRGNPRIASMTLAGMLPSPNGALGPWLQDWISLVETQGVEAWARATMPGRMADALSPAALDWWIALMAAAPQRTVAASLRLLPSLAGPRDPEAVSCPTLFIVADGSGATASGRYNQRPAIADLERLQRRVPNSALATIAADSFHISATHPDLCAETALAFIEGLAPHKTTRPETR
ncbi:MAG TPA: alpha/beta fold hydrolase [Burkholderiaceae bacterium]|jgi:pimeloyl-ACP methyl ester carboxylesterase